MAEVRLRPVSYAELSALRHEVAVADGPPFQAAEFLVIRYFGSYRDGAEGEPDAKYILAAAASAQKAWWAYSTILDFRELEYRWGDNMEWISRIGWDPGLRLHWPLAVVVGDKCRDALQSLLRDSLPWCEDTSLARRGHSLARPGAFERRLLLVPRRRTALQK